MFGLQAWDPGEKVSFLYRSRRIEYRHEERSVSRRKENVIDETGHRSGPSENVRRNGSGAKGERLLLKARNVSKK